MQEKQRKDGRRKFIDLEEREGEGTKKPAFKRVKSWRMVFGQFFFRMAGRLESRQPVRAPAESIRTSVRLPALPAVNS